MRIWTLTDLTSFEKTDTGWSLSRSTAFRENLLGVLAGDCAYQLMDGVGLHIKAKKLEEVGQFLKMQITKAWFSDGRGNAYAKTPKGLWPLFLASDFRGDIEVTARQVTQTYLFDSEKTGISEIQWLHRALPIVVRFSLDRHQEIPWQEKLRKSELPLSAPTLIATLRKTVGTFTRYVLFQEPKTRPIDSCINNVLYWDSEGKHETSWESWCLGKKAAEGYRAVRRGQTDR